MSFLVPPKLFNGEESTLGNFLKMVKKQNAEYGLYGKNAIAFLEEKIKNSPEGENEVVLISERRMLAILYEKDH